MAVSANLKDFISHDACQMLINDLWLGGIKKRKNVTYKVITALLFPPALFVIHFKSAKELKFMQQTVEINKPKFKKKMNINPQVNYGIKTIVTI